MLNINPYDIDIARENGSAIRAEVARNLLAREVQSEQASGRWLARRLDSLLVRIGDRASARQATRAHVSVDMPRRGGSQPQGR